MVPCPHCETSYNPRLAKCPRCKTYDTPKEEHQRALKLKVAEDLDAGVPGAQIAAYLSRAGFSESQVVVVMEDAAKSVASSNRGYALQRVILGVLALVGCLALRPVGAEVASVKWIARALGAFGGAAIMSGLYSTFTGKDRGDRRD